MPIRRHRDIVILGAAVDPRRIGLDALEQRSTASTPNRWLCVCAALLEVDFSCSSSPSLP